MKELAEKETKVQIDAVEHNTNKNIYGKGRSVKGIVSSRDK